MTKSVIDAFSHGLGAGDPTVRSTSTVGTGPGAQPWTQDGQEWGPLPAVPKANRLDLTLTNVKSARIDARRARGSHTYLISPRPTVAMCTASDSGPPTAPQSRPAAGVSLPATGPSLSPLLGLALIMGALGAGRARRGTRQA